MSHFSFCPVHKELTQSQQFKLKALLFFLVALTSSLEFWIFTPGVMWDARGFVDDARRGIFNDWQSPWLASWWRLTLDTAGPAGLFIVQYLPLYVGIVLIGVLLIESGVLLGAFLPVVTLFPQVFGTMSLLDKDLSMGSALLLCSVLCVMPRRGGWNFVSVSTVLLGSAWITITRLNAAAALPPVLVFMFLRMIKGRWRITKSIMLAAIASGGLFVTTSVITEKLFKPEHRHIAGLTMLHDITAIMVEDNLDMDVYPQKLKAKLKVTRSKLLEKFRPVAVDSLFWHYKNPFKDFSRMTADDEMNEVYSAWLDAVRRHPATYVNHRWMMFSALMSAERADKIILPRETDLLRPSDQLKRIRLFLDAINNSHSPMYDAWIWLAFGTLSVLTVCSLNSAPWIRALVIELCASAALYLFGFFWVLPGPFSRYLWWPALALWCATLITLLTAAQTLYSFFAAQFFNQAIDPIRRPLP